MQGLYVVTFYQNNFSYRFVSDIDNTIYLDRDLYSFETEAEALAALSFLESGFELGWAAGYAQAENDVEAI